MLFFLIFLKFLGIVISLLVSIAYFTVAERRLIGSIQRRQGPNVVGFFGVFQALADGLKLFVKESIVPSSATKPLFMFAPALTFFLSLIAWGVLPFGLGAVFADINLGVLYLFAISSLGVYGVIIAGWASNSKYAFLGALRSAAQIISYEVALGFIIVTIVLSTGTLNLSKIVLAQKNVWLCVPLFPMFVLFFISALAETNRHPFDLPEAEAELVSGYNVEYSAIGFALFFLGEYGNIIIISGLTALLFLGGWGFLYNTNGASIFLAGKTFFFIVLFIWARAALPRFRYDQLIRLGWQVFLPLALAWVVVTSSVLLAFNWMP